MSQAIATGLIPPRPGLEREEPEQAIEDDIPPDEGSELPPDDGAELPEGQQPRNVQRPLRQVERE